MRVDSDIQLLCVVEPRVDSDIRLLCVVEPRVDSDIQLLCVVEPVFLMINFILYGLFCRSESAE